LWLSFDDLNNEERFSLETLRDSYVIGGVKEKMHYFLFT